MAFCLFSTLGCAAGAAQHGSSNEKGYMTIEELHAFCRQLGRCGYQWCCEGETVKVKGYLDPMNIYEKKESPWLPHDKFRILGSPDPQHDASDSLEVYPVEGNISLLFEKLRHAAKSPSKLLYLRGRIEGMDAHTNLGRFRLIHLKIDADAVTLSESI